MKTFSEWKVKDLIDEAHGLCQTINELGCYGTKDLLIYEGVLRELRRRGFEVEEVSTLRIQKNGKCF
jgi:hypothetical protein